MHTFRAYRSADTALTLYVRDEDGQKDLDAVEELTLSISRYGAPNDSLATVEATSPSAGKVTATITTEVADETLGPGLFRMDLIADDALLRSDVLEVV